MGSKQRYNLSSIDQIKDMNHRQKRTGRTRVNLRPSQDEGTCGATPVRDLWRINARSIHHHKGEIYTTYTSRIDVLPRLSLVALMHVNINININISIASAPNPSVLKARELVL